MFYPYKAENLEETLLMFKDTINSNDMSRNKRFISLDSYKMEDKDAEKAGSCDKDI